MKPTRYSIVNGKILTPNRCIPSGTVQVENGIITGVHEGTIRLAGSTEIDAGGKYIAPGFIDIHVHGGGGADFMDASEEAFRQVAETHLSHGTTAMTPTTLTAGKDELAETLTVCQRAMASQAGGVRFLGMHLEGPYFALNQRGAQDPRYIRNPDPEEYQDLINRFSGIVSRWSAAPELPGALDFARYAVSKGILVSLAHTDALYDDVVKGFDHGYTLATHLYSAMNGVTRRGTFRYAGAVEAAFLIPEMDVEIIADGIHLPPPLLRLVYQIKGPDRIALVTDAMRGAGMPEGPSILGSLRHGINVLVEDGVAKMPDRSGFAGSVATMDRLVRTMVHQAHIPLIDAVKMASSTPARMMGATHLGTLAEGKRADILLFDDDIRIKLVMVDGQVLVNKL